jgi:hypothetical protein
MEPRTDITSYDDPRRLRDLLARAADLAERHGLRSVLVGLSGFEGDVAFPEIVRFVESALRVDDSVFRMTRERVLLLLTVVDEKSAAAILTRTLEDFREHFPSSESPSVGLGYFEVAPGAKELTVKSILPALFASPPKTH